MHGTPAIVKWGAVMYNFIMGKGALVKRLLAGIGFCVFLSGQALPWEMPPIKKKCETCHVSHNMGGSLMLKAPLSELCLTCHPDRVAPSEHKVDIVPSMKVEKLPLDEEGRMTCVTCHDPHGTSKVVRMLRMESAKLCKSCHKM